VPMKILCLHVKREHIGEQSTQVARYLLNCISAKISSRCGCIVP
jgi:hypothetical protein